MKTSMPSAAKANLLYQRVARSVQRAIDSGRYQPGERLPDERRLAAEQGVSRVTVRHALQILCDAQRIQRIQGSGTYVARGLSTASHIQLIAVGATVRHSPYVASVLGEAERSASNHNRLLVVRYLESPGLLPEAFKAAETDSSVSGGILVGYVSEADVRPARALRTPWVMLGDYTDAERHAPVIDQVCGDGYAWAEHAVRALLARGVRRPALLTYDSAGVWTRDRISAFRSVCDSAGITPSDQHIRSLFQDAIGGGERVRGAVRDGVAQAMTAWSRLRNGPDGVVLPGQVLPDWLDLARTVAGSAPLRRAALVAMDFEQQRRSAPVATEGQSIIWAFMCMAQMTDQAMQRLSEPPREARAPVRDYIRDVTLA